MPYVRTFFLGLALLGWHAAAAQAQNGNMQEKVQRENAIFQGIRWQHGPCTVKLRDIGEAKIPAGCKFTDEAGTASMMQITGNLVNPNDLGLVCPTNYELGPGDHNWFVVFVWDNIGYVKDDEKDNLDADAILKDLREKNTIGNQQRVAKGLRPLDIVGWQQPPFYDPATNKLTWAIRLSDAGMENVNREAKILGRRGVVSVLLVSSAVNELPKYNEIIRGYSFQSGQKHSEWVAGDAVAAHGLTALIAGGAVAAMAKSGLLGKIGKFIIYIVIGAVALIGGIFKKIFGGGKASTA